jgi:HSP20 family molecular chaperone IbpA
VDSARSIKRVKGVRKGSSAVTAKRKAQDQRVAVPIITGAALGDLAREVSESVGRRAYQFYQSRGGEHGQDLADWLRAESELTGLKEQITQSPDEVRIEVPLDGLPDTELQVGVDRSHVVVTARTLPDAEPEQTPRGASIRAAKRIDLPAEIDPTRAEATSDGRTLKVVLPKVSAS